MTPRHRVRVTLCALAVTATARAGTGTAELAGRFTLSGARPAGTRYYIQTTVIRHFAPDGKSAGIETWDLRLSRTRKSGLQGAGDEIRCLRLAYRGQGADTALAIPSLEGWTYVFRTLPTGLDDDGRVFGIDHAPFEGLKTADGKALPPVAAYAAYNNFIDFHGFCDVFAASSDSGGGIEDLHRIGDRVVHAASFTEPPVNVGQNILPGSRFRNGEVIMTFKGLTRVQGRTCALAGFDSGESSFQMKMRPAPGVEVEAVGRSRYFGDLAVDLESFWPLSVDLAELVVAEARVPSASMTVHDVVERRLTLEDVPRERVESP
jgi:hypothetical protein